MKIDLHVHSKYSTRPAAWVLKKIGTPESFTQPLQIYRIARRRGMNWVTISDHNRIEGALEIAHLPLISKPTLNHSLIVSQHYPDNNVSSGQTGAFQAPLATGPNSSARRPKVNSSVYNHK